MIRLAPRLHPDVVSRKEQRWYDQQDRVVDQLVRDDPVAKLDRGVGKPNLAVPRETPIE